MTIVEDLTTLGSDIVEISKNIELMIKKSSCINIRGIGIVDKTNKDVVIKTINLMYGIRKQLKAPQGSSRKLSSDKELKLVAYAQKGYKRAQIAKKFNISVATVNRILKRHNVKLSGGRPKKK